MIIHQLRKKKKKGEQSVFFNNNNAISTVELYIDITSAKSEKQNEYFDTQHYIEWILSNYYKSS